MTAFKAALVLALTLCGWLVLSALANEPRVSIRNRGLVASEPVDWNIIVTVDPQPEHRLLVVEVDGQPGEYRRSDYALNGEKAARIRQIWFKGLRAGCYSFAASVWSTSEVLGVARAGPVHVIGRDGDPCG